MMHCATSLTFYDLFFRVFSADFLTTAGKFLCRSSTDTTVELNTVAFEVMGLNIDFKQYAKTFSNNQGF